MKPDIIRELKTVAGYALGSAKKNGVGDARVMVKKGRNTGVTYRSGKLDAIKESESTGLYVALYIKGRFTTFSSSDLREAGIDSAMERAATFCRAMKSDTCRAITDPELYRGRKKGDLKIYDDGIDSVTGDSRLEYVGTSQRAVLKHTGRAAISAETTYSDSEEYSYQVHSNGFEGERALTKFRSYIVVSLRDKGGRRPQHSFMAGSSYRNDLMAPPEAGRQAAEGALLRLGARTISTERLPMIVENRVAQRLFRMLLGPMKGTALQMESSFLKGKIGKPVAGGLLTMYDDPFIEKSFNSRFFDSEGISAVKIPLIEKGVLRNFYIDTYYGKKLSMPPTTGSPSNIVIVPGVKALPDLVADTGRGVLVRGFIGGNSNDVTGDFSLGIYGSYIENGKISHAVSGMNISGNQKELWGRLAALGSDVYTYSRVRSPSLLFDGVQFTGR